MILWDRKEKERRARIRRRDLLQKQQQKLQKRRSEKSKKKASERRGTIAPCGRGSFSKTASRSLVRRSLGIKEPSESATQRVRDVHSGITHAAVMSAMGTGTTRIRGNTATAKTAYTRLVQVMSNAWAPTTMGQRRSLMVRFQAWCLREKQDAESADSAVLFIMALEVEVQSHYAYALQLSGTFKKLGRPNSALLNLSSSLRQAGAHLPKKQAAPMTRSVVERWILPQSPSIRLTMMLAWKTASRFTETASLTRENFIHLAHDEVIIDWKTIPKGFRSNPDKPSRFAVITGTWTREIYDLVKYLRPGHKVCPLNRTQMVNFWRTDKSMRQFTAHSIKRGAIQHLFQRAAAGELKELHLISLLAKQR